MNTSQVGESSEKTPNSARSGRIAVWGKRKPWRWLPEVEEPSFGLFLLPSIQEESGKGSGLISTLGAVAVVGLFTFDGQ